MENDREQLIDISSPPNEEKFIITQYLAHFASIICLGIKAYIVYSLWVAFLPADLSSYVLSVLGDNFYYSVISLINKCLAWLGIILLSLEPLYQCYMRFNIFKDKLEYGKKLNFFRLNSFIFAFLHGFVPEICFIINKIDINNDGNFFVDIYRWKTYGEMILIIIILVCIALAVLALCCGKGEYLGTWKRTRIYASGRESISYENAYGPDYEGAAICCTTGMSCGVILVLCVLFLFPFIVGISAYVFNLSYLKNQLLQYLYISEFCISQLHIHFYSIFYL